MDDPLRDRVLAALFEGHYGFPHDPTRHSDFSGRFHDEADAVLTALGLMEYDPRPVRSDLSMALQMIRDGAPGLAIGCIENALSELPDDPFLASLATDPAEQPA